MKNSYIAAIALIGIVTSSLLAEETIPKKTLAIIYEEGKTSEALFCRALTFYKKLIPEKLLKTAELGNSKLYGQVINFQTDGDDEYMLKYRVQGSSNHIKEIMANSNEPYTGRFNHYSENLFFGDKSLGYAINPYRGCYQHDFLAKGLEQTGFKLVNASENPDITMTIGIDACMSETEYKEYIQKNTTLKINNVNTATSTNGSGIGNDLIRSGSSAQLGTPTGGGNAGISVAGVGIALNMVNWLTTKSPQERDVIRYHVKFEGKDKTPLDFYPFMLSKNTHKVGTSIDIGSYQEAEKALFTSFLAWNALGGSFNDQLPAVLFEKDILKATEMMVGNKK